MICVPSTRSSKRRWMRSAIIWFFGRSASPKRSSVAHQNLCQITHGMQTEAIIIIDLRHCTKLETELEADCQHLAIDGVLFNYRSFWFMSRLVVENGFYGHSLCRLFVWQCLERPQSRTASNSDCSFITIRNRQFVASNLNGSNCEIRDCHFWLWLDQSIASQRGWHSDLYCLWLKMERFLGHILLSYTDTNSDWLSISIIDIPLRSAYTLNLWQLEIAYFMKSNLPPSHHLIQLQEYYSLIWKMRKRKTRKKAKRFLCHRWDAKLVGSIMQNIDKEDTLKLPTELIDIKNNILLLPTACYVSYVILTMLYIECWCKPFSA